MTASSTSIDVSPATTPRLKRKSIKRKTHRDRVKALEKILTVASKEARQWRKRYVETRKKCQKAKGKNRTVRKKAEETKGPGSNAFDLMAVAVF